MLHGINNRSGRDKCDECRRQPAVAFHMRGRFQVFVCNHCGQKQGNSNRKVLVSKFSDAKDTRAPIGLARTAS